MNDRIKELAKQSGIFFEDNRQNRIHSVSTDTLQKFAESIVKECAIVGMVMTDDHFDVEQLYKHFGIES